MLGQVRKVALSGERDDHLQNERPLLESEKRERTDQLLLAAAEIEYQEDIIREREEGINAIHRDVNTIHSLFQDIATHVTTHGEMLDHIESNVTAARDETSRANDELQRASRRGPSGRKTLAQFLLLLLLFVILLVLFKQLFHSPGYVLADVFGIHI